MTEAGLAKHAKTRSRKPAAIDIVSRLQRVDQDLSPAERRLILLDEGLRESVYRLPLEPTPKRNPLELRFASPRTSLAG
mgnify:CR=1 FL=1